MTPFQQGLEDRKAGRDLEACPFEAESESWSEWRRGWLIANTSGRFGATRRFASPRPDTGNAAG